MDYCKIIALLATAGAVLPVAQGKDGNPSPVEADSDHGFDLWTGEGFVLASADNAVRFTPYFNLSAVLGETSVDHPGDLFLGEHDPDENGLDLQSIEFAAGLEIGEYLSGRIAYHGFLDSEDELDGEVEELVGSLHDPDRELELRFGRYLNRFGFINETHAHDWSLIDTPLAVGRILGPHGLRSEGAEFNYAFGPRLSRSTFTVSFGQTVEHDHDHGGHHGEEEHHEHEHEDHDHDEHGHEHGEHNHDHEDHGHGHDHADEAFAFEDTFLSLRLQTHWIQNDFHRWTPAASFAFGSNASGGDTGIVGIGLTYNWLENGYEPGGARLTWSTEAFLRSLESGDSHNHDHDEGHAHGHDEDHAHEEDHDHGSESKGVDDEEFGFYSQVLYAPMPRLEFGGRVGYVSGSDEADLEERWRLSPVATAWLNEGQTVSLRAQYNYDILDSSEEHGIWLQLSISWGGHVH